MEGTWNVYFEDRPVGNCMTHREGLYIRFVCRCARISDSICRLLLRCGNGNVDLGVLIPVEGGYGLDRKLPVRNIPEGEPRFCVKLQGEQSAKRFIQVRDGEKFVFLSGLADARFGKQDGKTGVFLK